MSERVLVTGASGFVAGYVIDELRSHGYTIRGTARRPVDGLDDVVTADLSEDDGWAEAVDGCDYVMHVASPFPRNAPRSESELIRPAVDGTLRVLKAAAAANVKRVVLTSSVVAVSSGLYGEAERTEADWSNVDRCTPYTRSKTLAERAAWDFAAQSDLELTVVLPGIVFGPVRHPSVGTSVEVVRRLLNREVPASIKMGFAPVDVRDVAVGQRLALQTPEAAGNRYIMAGGHMWMRDVANMLAEEFNPQGYRVPTGVLPVWFAKVLAQFDPSVRQALDHVGRRELVSAEKARRELGWTMRSVRESIIETGYSLVEQGLAPNPATKAKAKEKVRAAA